MALPVELIDSICSNLQPQQLLVVATANSRFYHIVQRILYRHIRISSPLRLSLLIALSRNQHLARYVKSFELRLNPSAPLLNSFYRLLAQALSNMSQLTALDLCVHQDASWIMSATRDTTYHRLRHFSSSFHLDRHVASFLNKTENLIELQLAPLPLSPSLSLPILTPGALSQLSQFTGSPQVAQVIVPGRPVESVHLTSGDLTEDIAESLAKSTAPILVLIAATSSHSVSVLGTLTRYMPNLNHLRILSTYNFVDAPDTTYFSDIANALAAFPDLISCEIWGMLWVSSQTAFDDRGKVWQSETFSLDAGSAPTEYSDIHHA